MSQSSPHIVDHANGNKRRIFQDEKSVRPQKRTKTLLNEDSSSEGEDSSSRATQVISQEQDEYKSNGHGFTINQEYARRFEYNKKREEQQKCEWRVPDTQKEIY